MLTRRPFFRQKLMLVILFMAMIPIRLNLCTLVAGNLGVWLDVDPCLEELVDLAAQLATAVSAAAVMALPLTAAAAALLRTRERETIDLIAICEFIAAPAPRPPR